MDQEDDSQRKYINRSSPGTLRKEGVGFAKNS